MITTTINNFTCTHSQLGDVLYGSQRYVSYVLVLHEFILHIYIKIKIIFNSKN